MNVVVLGMGYVGCVTAAVLAREGHQVVGVDSNPTKVDLLQRGQSPVMEPGLAELVRRGQLAGRLTATTDAGDAFRTADVFILCVGTPSAKNGSLDPSHLEAVAAEVGAGIREHAGFPVIVLRSTALPDIIEDRVVAALERAAGGKVGTRFGFAVNPEFLREGTSIRDFDEPQFTLLGTDEPRSAAILERLYSFLSAPVIVTDRRTAPLVKYASNAFHALKVAFANEIGTISKAAGVDGREVMRIFCLDEKLNTSKAYLRPGMPFGGSCLPKDVRALLHHARSADFPAPVLAATLESNRLQTERCTEEILGNGRVRVGVFGMSFKAGTDDLRESPTLEIVERLIGKGATVAIYDKRVSLAHLLGANREYVDAHLPHIATLLRPTLEEVVADSDVLVIGNGDEEFRRIPELMRPDQTLIDLVGTVAPRPAAPARQRGVGA
jgi:GDP-mannose 6-dehydrogenase